MDKLSLVCSIVNMIGSIATAVSVIIMLHKFSKNLKVQGEFPIKNSNSFLIHIYNNTLYDNEIESILLYKGNPKHLVRDSILLGCITSPDGQYDINSNTKNVIIRKNSSLEIPISCQKIVDLYDEIGESIGKIYDKIFIVVKDRRGHKYCIDTKQNIDYLKAISKCKR